MLLAAATGFAVGFILRFPKLRKGLQIASLARGMAQKRS